jgi:2-polyprenyl-3-methyl-5-hydroxy-6-metoxy-1,4-benzoquinol methylase
VNDLVPDRAALVQATRQLWEWLVRLDESIKARALLEHLPYVIDDDPAVAQMRADADAMNGHLQSPAHYAYFYDAIWEAELPQSVEAFVQSGLGTARTCWLLHECRQRGVRTAVDFGAGTGAWTFFLAAFGIQTTGINLTERCMRAAEALNERLCLPASFVFAPCEAYRGPLVDAAFAFEIVEHVADPDALIAAMEANVRPGGVCLLTTPNGSTTYGKDTFADYPRLDFPRAHVRVYTPRRMREWLGQKRGFQMVDAQGWTQAGTLAVLWERA